MTVAARGADGAVWTRQRQDGTWGAWRSIGGATGAAPDVARLGPGLVEVVVRGTDGWLWDRAQTTATTYGTWRLLA
jgi:hypothetical protein